MMSKEKTAAIVAALLVYDYEEPIKKFGKWCKD